MSVARDSFVTYGCGQGRRRQRKGGAVDKEAHAASLGLLHARAMGSAEETRVGNGLSRWPEGGR